MKVIGNINWQIQPGSPELNGEKNSETLTATFVTPWADINDGMPDYDDEWNDERYPIGGSTESPLKLIAKRIRVKNTELAEITLTYGTNDRSGSSNKDEGVPEYELDNQPLPKPIEEHPKYLRKWNHDLCKHISEGDATRESWFDTETKTEENAIATTIVVNGKTVPKFVWVQAGDKAPSNYKKVGTAIYPGVETYNEYAPVVTKKTYYTRQTVADNDAKNDGQLITPGMTFGVTGKIWKQDGTSVRQDGKWYVATSVYVGVDRIIGDIYPVPAGGGES